MTDSTAPMGSSAKNPVNVFPDGSPSAALGGVQVFQATIQGRLPGGRPASDEQDLNLHMFCVPAEDGDEASFALISDLQVSKGPWFLAVSASSALLFRNRTDAPAPNVDGANALLKSLGPWASHALYDHLALTARTLLAAVPGCPITIPVETPHPHLTEIRKGRPASKQETDEV